MSNKLDSSWKYTTKVNIDSMARTEREAAYRQGIEDFKDKLIKKLNEQDDILDTIKFINELKND